MNSIKAMQLISKKKKTSHLLHIVLTLCTFGFWIPIWVLVAVSNSLENSRIDRQLNKLNKAEQGS